MAIENDELRAEAVEKLKFKAGRAGEEKISAVVSATMGVFIAFSGILKIISSLILGNFSFWTIVVYGAIATGLILMGRSFYKGYEVLAEEVEDDFDRLK